MDLGVPHALVAQVLENMLDAQEAPFTGRRRKVVVQWVARAVEAWVRELERRGVAGAGNINGRATAGGGAQAAGGAGAEGVGGWVGELLGRAEEALVQLAPNGQGAGGRAAAEGEEVLELRRVVAGLKRSVEGLLGGEERLGMGSLFR